LVLLASALLELAAPSTAQPSQAEQQQGLQPSEH